ncbi:MAG TPA: UDP-N-acetylmuramate dehydrogenase [Clostridiaceae bacterium]|nr:UDP-N-acetylmuramate dehydrogenase [Clostridiaceae bacterium]
MGKEIAIKLVSEIVGKDNIKIDEPMKNHTSFKIGGNADILVTPENSVQIAKVVEVCRREGIPFFVMGNGTNIIVRDKGIRGVVIKTCGKFERYAVEDTMIEAESGILLSKLADVALEHGLTGLEFASGIPGSLGGAVVMNAGAYDGEMKDVVVKTEYIDKDGLIKILEGDEHLFGYRTSVIQEEGGIVLRSWLKLQKGNKEDIKALMDNLNWRRKSKQPLEMPSAGSVFKRPPGFFTGKLIEDCGLKGYRIGGAEISTKHCGFIVNVGGATANDVINLIRHIQERIKSEYGIELKTEVKIVGED